MARGTQPTFTTASRTYVIRCVPDAEAVVRIEPAQHRHGLLDGQPLGDLDHPPGLLRALADVGRDASDEHDVDSRRGRKNGLEDRARSLILDLPVLGEQDLGVVEHDHSIAGSQLTQEKVETLLDGPRLVLPDVEQLLGGCLVEQRGTTFEQSVDAEGRVAGAEIGNPVDMGRGFAVRPAVVLQAGHDGADDRALAHPFTAHDGHHAHVGIRQVLAELELLSLPIEDLAQVGERARAPNARRQLACPRSGRCSRIDDTQAWADRKDERIGGTHVQHGHGPLPGVDVQVENGEPRRRDCLVDADTACQLGVEDLTESDRGSIGDAELHPDHGGDTFGDERRRDAVPGRYSVLSSGIAGAEHAHSDATATQLQCKRRGADQLRATFVVAQDDAPDARRSAGLVVDLIGFDDAMAAEMKEIDALPELLLQLRHRGVDHEVALDLDSGHREACERLVDRSTLLVEIQRHIRLCLRGARDQTEMRRIDGTERRVGLAQRWVTDDRNERIEGEEVSFRAFAWLQLQVTQLPRNDHQRRVTDQQSEPQRGVIVRDPAQCIGEKVPNLPGR